MSRATTDQIAALPHCQKCQRYMRPHRGTSADWPGTTSRHNLVLCGGCQARTRKALTVDDTAERERAAYVRNQVNLNAFLTERRRRGVPADGLRVEA